MISNWCLWQHSHDGLPVVIGEWVHNDINEGGFCFGYRLLQLTICQSLWGRKHDDFLGIHVLTKQSLASQEAFFSDTGISNTRQ